MLKFIYLSRSYCNVVDYGVNAMLCIVPHSLLDVQEVEFCCFDLVLGRVG
jgi:hypothetical protein